VALALLGAAAADTRRKALSLLVLLTTVDTVRSDLRSADRAWL
jgi:hypothetical protein